MQLLDRSFDVSTTAVSTVQMSLEARVCMRGSAMLKPCAQLIAV